MYYVIINRKTGVIETTVDTLEETVTAIEAIKARLSANGQRDPGFMIQSR